MLNDTVIKTGWSKWEKLKATNFTNSAFATLKSTLTEPTGDGIIDMTNAENRTWVENAILLRPFGVGNEGDTFAIRIYGWSKEISTGSWENALLADLTCTLGALAGTASCAIADTDKECKTITQTIDCITEIVSPATNVRGAHVMIDHRGFQKFQVDFDMTGATSANVIWRGL